MKLSDIPTDANIVGGRFVLAVKNKGTKDEKGKARYVAHGHRDIENLFMFYNITTLKLNSAKILVSACSIFNSRINSHDVKQAGLQSDNLCSKEVYLKPKKEDRACFNLADDEILFLLEISMVSQILGTIGVSLKIDTSGKIFP